MFLITVLHHRDDTMGNERQLLCHGQYSNYYWYTSHQKWRVFIALDQWRDQPQSSCLAVTEEKEEEGFDYDYDFHGSGNNDYGD